jgi:hypothetical protein
MLDPIVGNQKCVITRVSCNVSTPARAACPGAAGLSENDDLQVCVIERRSQVVTDTVRTV